MMSAQQAPFADKSIRFSAAPALDAALLDRARAFPAATLHEAAGKIGALPSAIKPVSPAFTTCGRAFTVQGIAGDNLWIHRALSVADPGDVLVVTVGGHHEAGYWGEIMSTAARTKGLAGLVIDGCVRDAALLAEIGFPVFSRGLCIRGTDKAFGSPGALNVPVMVGEVVVNAGDLVVGDIDGVVVVPHAQMGAVLAASAKREAQEAEILSRLRGGESTLSVYGWDR
jgi:4-hydroxy-4-methyl-2-oxoglutarate aldolase